MRLTFVIALSLIAAALPGCLPEPDLNVRLDGTWLFRADPDRRGMGEGWYDPGTDRSRWSPVRVPSPWESYPGTESHDGWGWYARLIVLADSIPPLSLHFAGADDDAAVWINGTLVAEHSGYSEPFSVNATPALRPGENLLVVLVKDHGGPGGLIRPVTLVQSDRLEEILRGPYALRDARESPDWVRDAVIYSVYLRSFSPEGTFEGLRRRIPELKSTGASVLWLLPVHPIGEIRRKGTLGSPYSIRDYYGVNPEFGTLDDLRALVRTAHDHDMRVILDLVANHTSWDNPLLTEHPDWYTRDAGGSVVPPNRDWSDVADLDFAQPGLRRSLIDMMCWWVEEVGIDGYRCDVAELVPLEFWLEARRHLEEIRPVMMLAEGTLPEYHLEAFDLTYAWNTYDLLQTLLRGEEAPERLHRAMHQEDLRFPRGSLRLRFTTNHDKNYWDAPAVEKFGAAGLRQGTVLMFTLPGVPLIYTGEEVANDRRLSLFDKVEVDWRRPRAMAALYGELSRLRSAHPALRAGEYRPVPADDDAVLAFSRTAGSDRVLTVLNLSDIPRTVRLEAPWLAGGLFREHGSGRSARAGDDGSLSVSLAPRGWAILLAAP